MPNSLTRISAGGTAPTSLGPEEAGHYDYEAGSIRNTAPSF